MLSGIDGSAIHCPNKSHSAYELLFGIDARYFDVFPTVSWKDWDGE